MASVLRLLGRLEMAARSAPHQILRYDVRILLPSLPMRQAGPWFIESSHRSQAEAEARYAALLLVAQTERGSIELIQVAVNGPGARQDAKSLQAWSYRPGTSAFGLRAWPMDKTCKDQIELTAAELGQRAANGEVIDTFQYSPPARKEPSMLEVATLAFRQKWQLFAITVGACVVFAIGVGYGRQTARPVVTASLVGITSPRWCIEVDEEHRMVRLWTEHPEMSVDELVERRQLEGIKRLQGADETRIRKSTSLMKLNFFDGLR